MNISESKQHDILLVITSLLFILFSTGLSLPAKTPANTLVIPSA